MPLLPGTRVGPYEIQAPLGAGGMGEVYRARDARLGRDVAIKVLPEAFISDAQRLTRFQREAQVLASLNHPNIATIHGLEESGAVHALVMELVEGPTLDGRIAQGPLALEEALPLARQIAEALEYAHDRGIIHRDLKPANIKVTPAGQVKVLDFGLAKALDDSPAAEDISNSPTLTAAATKAGIILGTAAYMSPEQAKGKPVDRRADIWSFGVVLYEMLSGRQMYCGETASETLAHVITQDPKWDALPAGLPLPIRRLLERCLTKDPKRRLRDIGEARLVIEDYLADPKAASTTAAPAAVGAPAKWQRLLPWAVALLLAAAALAAWWRPAPEPPRVVRAFIPPPEKTIFDSVGSPNAGPVAVSPDGRLVVFGAAAEGGSRLLWVRAIDSLIAQPLSGTENGAYPFWSPDSRSVGFFAGGKVKKIDVSGGPPITLCDAASGRGAAWNRDNLIVFSPDSAMPLHRVSASGGASTPVTKLDQVRGESTHRWPQFLPDGRHFLFLTRIGPGVGGLEGTGIMVGSLDGAAPKFLLQASSNPAYASGHLLFVRENTLMAQPFDPDKLELRGDAFPIAEQIQFDGAFTRGVFSVSEDGVLVYQTGAPSTGSRLLWFDRTGKPLGALGDQAIYFDVSISPDQRRVAVNVLDPRVGPPDLWVFEVVRGLRTRFTFGSGAETNPVWAPDSTRVAFRASPKAAPDLYEKSLAGTGQEQPLLESTQAKFPYSWSSDGRFLAYEMRGVAKTATDIWVLPLTGDRKPVPFLETTFLERSPQFSPDGRWIAYVSDESGRDEVYVAPFPGPGRKWQISTSSGDRPRWRRDGREIYYLASDNKIIAVEVGARGDTFEVGAAKALFETRAMRGGNVYDVTADGRRFLVNTLVHLQTSSPLTLVVNWPVGLKKK